MRTTPLTTHTLRVTSATRVALALVAVSALVVGAAGCGDGGGGDGKKQDDAAKPSAPTVELPKLNGQTLQVAAVWTRTEQKNFTAVLEEFEKRTGAEVRFVPTGDSISTYLGTKIEGGEPPDVAVLPQVGALRQFADKGWLKPVAPEVTAQLEKNYAKGWRELGAHKGKQYGVWFKAANKSLVWYNSAAFENAGASVPTTWDEFLKTAETISASGVAPIAVAGADGWTLTDWFENVYLSQAGPEKYDRLAAHEIKWTDPSVAQALTTLGKLFGDRNLLLGGQAGALQTEFPKSVAQVFAGGDQPEAAMVYEGAFVADTITNDTKAKIGSDAKVFPFPKVGAEAPVVSGGDVAVALKDGPGAQALLTFLASPDAAEIWARAGGFLSPNKSLDPKAYPDDTQRSIAKALVDAGDDFRFDMSDQAPASFGGTKGAGEWKALQDFLKNPSDVAGTQRALEADAARAYKS
ncbi:ABC transporter substrate-binding protein [Streptomyces sp. URMC 123]|uniref:ABC transporter substrate-binding protein n=1 Tax=Streptomyces sp. URMC 123 TaxID=3423403 RepID=UPI003F1DF827